MSPQLATVLEIAAVGATLLFTALAGLIGLMYILTSPWPRARRARPAGQPPTSTATALAETTDERPTAEEEAAQEAEERDRQRRAVALAAAVACADSGRVAATVPEAPPEWRRLHRTRRLNQPRSRTRARSLLRVTMSRSPW